jgi:hypothetical protein
VIQLVQCFGAPLRGRAVTEQHQREMQIQPGSEQPPRDGLA